MAGALRIVHERAPATPTAKATVSKDGVGSKGLESDWTDRAAATHHGRLVFPVSAGCKRTSRSPCSTCRPTRAGTTPPTTRAARGCATWSAGRTKGVRSTQTRPLPWSPGSMSAAAAAIPDAGCVTRPQEASWDPSCGAFVVPKTGEHPVCDTGRPDPPRQAPRDPRTPSLLGVGGSGSVDLAHCAILLARRSELG